MSHRDTFIQDRTTFGILIQTELGDGTWVACDGCGMLFDARENAEQHETDCDGEEPSYIQ